MPPTFPYYWNSSHCQIFPLTATCKDYRLLYEEQQVSREKQLSICCFYLSPSALLCFSCKLQSILSSYQWAKQCQSKKMYILKNWWSFFSPSLSCSFLAEMPEFFTLCTSHVLQRVCWYAIILNAFDGGFTLIYVMPDSRNVCYWT